MCNARSSMKVIRWPWIVSLYWMIVLGAMSVACSRVPSAQRSLVRADAEAFESVVRSEMIDSVKGLKHAAARLARCDGAYLRFAGDLEVSQQRGGELIETYKDEAIWELMYFGRARGVA